MISRFMVSGLIFIAAFAFADSNDHDVSKSRRSRHEVLVQASSVRDSAAFKDVLRKAGDARVFFGLGFNLFLHWYVGVGRRVDASLYFTVG